MSTRLGNAVAAQHLSYERAAITPGIVHLGIGAFCRAHIADYIDRLLDRDPSWGIIGASLRRPDTRTALAPQDFLYTLAIRNAESTKIRVIGSLLDVLDANTQRDRLLEAMADPHIRIVSLTVTEKGYCHDPATGELDHEHPDIRHDLANPRTPVSAIGLIVEALEKRWKAGLEAFTVLCCDNLPSNGETTAKVVTGFAALRDHALAEHITRYVAFPSTMVDRIVPATTPEDRDFIHSSSGFEDAWPVVTEPFTQWVIEDRFPAGRPDFASVGAEMVADVKPYELMKLRMLNGSHSSLAYLGYLSGHEYVSDAIGNQHFHRFVHRLMSEEAMATLSMPLTDLNSYRDALLHRFSNPALKHRTWQIAMDGSQKLPQRLLGTIRDNLRNNRGIDCSALGVAAWMRYVTGVDERGNAIEVKDPLARRFKDISEAAGCEPERLVMGLLQVKEVFADDLQQNETFYLTLINHLHSLYAHGALKTVQNLVA